MTYFRKTLNPFSPSGDQQQREYSNLWKKNGLIIREPVPYDARLKKLVPTQKALAVNRRLEEEFKRINAQLIHGLTKEELDIFCSVAEKMQANLNGGES